MKSLLSLALVSIGAMSMSQTFFDNFNRADGGLGANYSLITGPATNVIGNQAGGTSGANGLTLVNAGTFTGAYNSTKVSADLSLTDASASVAYCALVLGGDGTATASHGIFVKLQRQIAGGFSHIGAYTGSGSNTAAIALTGGNFQTLASQITSTGCRYGALRPRPCKSVWITTSTARTM